MSRPTITYKRRNKGLAPQTVVVSSPIQPLDKEEISREEMASRMLKRSRSHSLFKQPFANQGPISNIHDSHRTKRQKSTHSLVDSLGFDAQPFTPSPTPQSKSTSYFMPSSKPLQPISIDISPLTAPQEIIGRRTSSSHLKENSTRLRRYARTQHALESPFATQSDSNSTEADRNVGRPKTPRKPLSNAPHKKHKHVRSADRNAEQASDNPTTSPKIAFLARRPSVPSFAQPASSGSPKGWLVSSNAFSPSFDRPPSELGFSGFINGDFYTSTPFVRTDDRATFGQVGHSSPLAKGAGHDLLPEDNLFSSYPEGDATMSHSSFIVYRDASMEDENITPQQQLPLAPPTPPNIVRGDTVELSGLLCSLDLRPSPIRRRKSTQDDYQDSLISPTLNLSLNNRTRSLDSSIDAQATEVPRAAVPRRRERGATIRASDFPPLRTSGSVVEKLKNGKLDGTRRTRSGTIVGPPLAPVLAAKQNTLADNRRALHPHNDCPPSQGSSGSDLLPAVSISGGSSSETRIDVDSDDELLLKESWNDDDWPIEPVNVKPATRRLKYPKRPQTQPIRIKVGEWAEMQDRSDPLQRGVMRQ